MFNRDITKIDFSFKIQEDLEMLKLFRIKEIEDKIALEQSKPIKDKYKIWELKQNKNKWSIGLFNQHMKDYEIYKELFYSYLKSKNTKYYYAYEHKERNNNIVKYLRKIRRHSQHHLSLPSTVRLVSKEFNIFEQHIREILSEIRKNIEKGAWNDTYIRTRVWPNRTVCW